MNFATALNKLWATTPAETRTAIAMCAPKFFHLFNMEEPLVICHFMAQIGHESGNGKIRREDMSYRAGRIMEIFGVGRHSAKVTEKEARALERNPTALAERVYGLGNPKKAKELGNTRPGDGYRFRGNGFLQLTGRASHAAIGKMIGVDLESNPELLAEPKVSFAAACAEFQRLKCIPPARADDIIKVTKRVNGGRNGLAERQVNLRRWKEALDGVDAPVQAPRFAEVDAAPSLLGTRTGQIGAVTGFAGTVSAGTQIAEYTSSISDTVETVRDNGTQVLETVKIVKPFLGFSPEVWTAIGIGATAAVVIGVVCILVYRHLKIRNEAQ